MTVSDQLLGATQAGPSLLGAALRMGFALALLCAAAWAWFYWQRRVKGPTRHLEVIDRAMLARGAGVALLRVEGKRILVGVSAEGVRLIRDLDAGDRSEFDKLIDEAGAETGG